ncbi:MAG: sigma-54-dependent Fis family transcriptional regulator [Thermoplasmata archaeon]|nr:sigma-54-dependent Fis family transcriptional regulator [Thermoplasmata archaeon]
MAGKRILVVEADPETGRLVLETLKHTGHEVTLTASGEQGLGELEDGFFDIVFIAVELSDAAGMDFLARARNLFPDIAVIMMTEYGTVRDTVRAVGMGTTDYLIKPFSAEQIELAVKKIFDTRKLIEENRYLRSEIAKWFGKIVGETEVMKKLFRQMEKAARNTAAVLVYGENGTGKGLVAHAIHCMSPRRMSPFIRLNCAALPEDLLKTEMLGQEGRLFTGAQGRQQGKLELADTGTLLLDEVSELPAGLQAKLLRVLQEREFGRVGGRKAVRIDVRIISTTNRDLAEEVGERRFREDLFYRLNIVPVYVPALRERKQDILLLARHFAERFSAEKNRETKTISDAAIEAMYRYDWPGNVREMENVIERAILLSPSDKISMGHLLLDPEATMSRKNMLDVPILTLAAMERRLILKTLDRLGGHRGRTARELDISVRTLRNKLNLYRGATASRQGGSG